MFYWVLIFSSVAIWGAQFKLRSFLALWAKRLYIFFTFICFGYLFLITYLQYNIWKGNDLTSGFLPPASDWGYFIKYSFYRFWIIYLVSFFLSLLFIFIGDYFNKKYQERFFESGEVYLGGVSILISGYPGVVFYIIVFFLIFLISSLFFYFIRGNNFRLSPYYLWMPTAVCVILTSIYFLNNLDIWKLLKF